MKVHDFDVNEVTFNLLIENECSIDFVYMPKCLALLKIHHHPPIAFVVPNICIIIS